MSDQQVYYRQCILKAGSVTLTTWLPEKKVEEGMRLSLKDHEDPDRVWTVDHIGFRQTEKWVKDRRKAHERWRAVTDV